MTKVAVRLARLEAAVPRPVRESLYDVSRLTAAQMEPMAELQPRYQVVGLIGLTDEEVEELAVMTELLKETNPFTKEQT